MCTNKLAPEWNISKGQTILSQCDRRREPIFLPGGQPSFWATRAHRLSLLTVSKPPSSVTICKMNDNWITDTPQMIRTVKVKTCQRSVSLIAVREVLNYSQPSCNVCCFQGTDLDLSECHMNNISYPSERKWNVLYVYFISKFKKNIYKNQERFRVQGLFSPYY